MKAGANEVTMDMMQEGKSCGVCHNGKVAFESNFDTCLRCHTKCTWPTDGAQPSSRSLR
jgi:c(7)-type cytochrome triheme protein